MPDDPALLAAWIRRWRDAGPALTEQRRRELTRLTPERALRLSDALLSGCPGASASSARRTSSGLVEQQALFQRWRQG